MKSGSGRSDLILINTWDIYKLAQSYSRVVRGRRWLLNPRRDRKEALFRQWHGGGTEETRGWPVSRLTLGASPVRELRPGMVPAAFIRLTQ